MQTIDRWSSRARTDGVMALSTHSTASCPSSNTSRLEDLELAAGALPPQLAESIKVLYRREGHRICGTPLAAAALAGDFDLVHQLLVAGADPSARSRTELSGAPEGKSVLELAAPGRPLRSRTARGCCDRCEVGPLGGADLSPRPPVESLHPTQPSLTAVR